eukprot:1083283-Alexandrium_andersonii.AAC.1
MDWAVPRRYLCELPRPGMQPFNETFRDRHEADPRREGPQGGQAAQRRTGGEGRQLVPEGGPTGASEQGEAVVVGCVACRGEKGEGPGCALSRFLLVGVSYRTKDVRQLAPVAELKAKGPGQVGATAR